MTKAILGLVLFSAALTAACGSSSDGGSQPTLDGTWQAQLANGCTGTFVFNGGKYGDNIICTLQNGNYGAEIEDGTFTKTATDLDLMPSESSCPAHAGAGTDSYTLRGTQLVLTIGATQLILEKVTPGSVNGGAVVEDGCWDFSQSPGLFTPGAIRKL